MRFLAFITFFSACAFGQAPDPIQTLLGEVQQLRLAIERSTLLGARTQIALQRIQIQEARTRQLEQDANGFRTQADSLTASRSQFEARLKDAEEQLPRVADPKQRLAMEQEVRMSKETLASMTMAEQQARAREVGATNQARLEQSKLQDLLARVDEMERVLDQAIRQITDKK
ncbi:MAG TPA: hypothetical protein VGP79_02025 [Bryobacteraceae bacterium]|jgi:predicted  nucleic acid-binding Zn-ribbon protein|nr:hypothetical protein [Bryobacteraceae bacterium]